VSGFQHFWNRATDHAQRRGAAAADVDQRLGGDLLEGVAAAPRARDIARAVPAFWARRRSPRAATSSPHSTAKACSSRCSPRPPRSPNADTLEAQGHVDSQLTRRLRDALHAVLRQLQYGQVLLASIGSTAPFIGLFGTVWGIYHALAASRRRLDHDRARVRPGRRGAGDDRRGPGGGDPRGAGLQHLRQAGGACEAELEGFAHDLREMISDSRRARASLSDAWPSAASSAAPPVAR
jgi:biopolymer transport protein ExbB